MNEKDRELLDKIHELAIQLSGADECEIIELQIDFNTVKVNRKSTRYVKAKRMFDK